MKEHVFVVLGVPKDDLGAMPATVSPWPSRRKGATKLQYLSADQLKQMGPDQTAIWEAEFVGTHYWLSHRLPDTAPVDPLRRGPRVVLEEMEIPF